MSEEKRNRGVWLVVGSIIAATAISSPAIILERKERREKLEQERQEAETRKPENGPWYDFWKNPNKEEVRQKLYAQLPFAENDFVRGRLIAAIAYLGDDSLLPELIEYAKKDETGSDTHSMSAYAMGNFGPDPTEGLSRISTRDGTKALVRLLYEDNARVVLRRGNYIIGFVMDAHGKRPEFRQMIEDELYRVLLTDHGDAYSCFLRADVARNLVLHGSENIRNHLAANKSGFECTYHWLSNGLGSDRTCYRVRNFIEQALEERAKRQR